MITTQPLRVGAQLRPLVPAGRRPSLHELVRDLAGWTPPAAPPATPCPPDGWARAWAAGPDERTQPGN